jgi:hypothetical protein
MKTLFALSNLTVMPFWSMMILLPKWRVTERIVRSPWIVAGPAIIYAVLVAPLALELMPALMRPEIGKIATFLASETGATIAWVHFLAFDLFVGRWVYLDSREREVSPWLMAPVLWMCLMLGPIGLLGYAVLRSLAAKRATQRVAVAA